jgi:hypothetical protein
VPGSGLQAEGRLVPSGGEFDRLGHPVRPAAGGDDPGAGSGERGEPAQHPVPQRQAGDLLFQAAKLGRVAGGQAKIAVFEVAETGARP